MRKVYFDVTTTTEIKNYCVGISIKDAEIIPAGTSILPMKTKDKNEEYSRYAEEYDIHFIFEDNIPILTFYTVPHVSIIAVDSDKGFIGIVGQDSDLESSAPVCYINRKKCFLIANTGKEFIKLVNVWKLRLSPYDSITFYNSKSEAQKELEFIEIPKIERI